MPTLPTLPTDVSRVVRMAGRFVDPGVVASAAPHGEGRIHDTFVVRLHPGESLRGLLLQRFNEHVFADIAAVMSNVARVCAHLQAKLDVAGGRRALRLVRTLDGGDYTRDDDGSAYRAFEWIDDAYSLPGARSAEDAREAGRALGELQRRLVDLPPPPLATTIPGFHDTVARLAALDAAVARDELGRAPGADREIALARAHAELAARVADAMHRGEIPQRIAHNDAKLDNVLFDAATGRAVCVVDFDTIMPGSWLYDFGDLARSVACGASEEAPATATLHERLPMLTALTEGYVGQVGPLLTPGEWETLVSAPRLIAAELGARFLTDHLQGDHYFRIDQPDQNLERARVQLAVATGFRDIEPELSSVIARLRV